MKEHLFTADFVRRLDALALLVRKTLCAGEGNAPRSRLKGGSVEFADHREYSPGDEWRYIDWNVYGRTGKLFVREFTGEASLAQHILVDTSVSMSFGTPGKFDLARQVAAAIAYVSMNEDTRVRVAFRSSSVARELAGLRSKSRAAALFEFLGDAVPEGETNMGRALRELAASHDARSSVAVISDLMEEGRVREGLSALAGRGHDVTILHVLSEGIPAPHRGDAVRLVDSETGETLDGYVDGHVMADFQSELDRHCARWQQFAQLHGMGYMAFSSSLACEQVVIDCLHNGLVFRMRRRLG